MSNTSATELRMGATELAEAVRSGQVSSCEVAGAHLRRTGEVNPAVNAVPVVLGEQALKTLREADRAAASGAELPPLHGVPLRQGEHRARQHADNLSPVIAHEKQHSRLPSQSPPMRPACQENLCVLITVLSPQGDGHDIPAAINSPGHRQGHDLWKDSTSPRLRSAHLPAASHFAKPAGHGNPR